MELTCPAPDRPLGATLWLPPAGTGPFAAGVALVGGQMWNRDGDLPDSAWHHYADVADAISRGGGAALLFDKGGTGATGGPPADDGQRVREAVAALACVRQRPEVDGGRVTLIGHSDGSVVATEVALGDPTLHGLVLLSRGADPERLAQLPVTLPVLLVRSEHDFGVEDDLERLRVLAGTAALAEPAAVRRGKNAASGPLTATGSARMILARGTRA